MQFKQTIEELDAVKVKVDKAFLPAILGEKAWASILPTLGVWLINNCANGREKLVDASTANIIRGITRLDGTGLFDWEIAPLKQPPKKQPDFQQSNDGGLPNHAKVEKQQAQVVLSANDVNSPVFQRRNHEAQERFFDLVSRGPISYRHGREDRGLTNARREKLQKMRVIARQRDSKGSEVPLFENMVTQAEEQIRKFEAEDARRQMS